MYVCVYINKCSVSWCKVSFILQTPYFSKHSPSLPCLFKPTLLIGWLFSEYLKLKFSSNCVNLRVYWPNFVLPVITHVRNTLDYCIYRSVHPYLSFTKQQFSKPKFERGLTIQLLFFRSHLNDRLVSHVMLNGN